MSFFEQEKPTDGECREHNREDRHQWHHDKASEGVVKPEGFLEACLLLLLSEEDSYGYELIARLQDFGFSDNQDPGTVYRYLRKLEKRGMIASEWDTSGTGPARRVYSMTPDGYDLLAAWAEIVRINMDILSRFLKRYEELGIAPEGKS
ncbi:MAG TPA: helix-turn-helix transcriptional regulator [Bacillota bacterium]|nr:helix-turn-helix transcriptional regulator [Bacillota bacterium]HOK64600.1 helix-turn-helix transcriptional regulator [Bacillota bacterium]HOL12147.1 helix-turn-helix transcriptional regulator [Bacillota bacterium]HOQ03261.1 helix-turn-helix transcriptional regulator [Bacillota bacterium]HPP60938.1 helix-turn-helix transcriptional regulator [Bacillota bacterium]